MTQAVTKFDEVMMMLPECIKEYHHYLSDKNNSNSAPLRVECEKEMDKYFKSLRLSSDVINPLSLDFFIMYSQYSIAKKTDGRTSQLVQFNRLHSQAKYYIHKIIKDELAGCSRQLSTPIHDSAESSYLLARSNGMQIADKEDFIKEKQEDIYISIQKEFLENRDAFLVEYTFFKSLSPKLQISYYLNDLNWFLVRNFNGNPDDYKKSIITKYPSAHIEYGTFSPSSASIQPNKLYVEENEENENKFFYEHPSNESSRNTKVYFSDAALPEPLEDTALDKMTSNNIVKKMFLGSANWDLLSSLPLDSKDMDLLVFEYNHITPQTLKTFSIPTTLKEMTKHLYPNYKKLTRKEYTDTFKRLIKINHYIVNATRQNEDGAVEIMNLPLYSSKITLQPKDKTGNSITANSYAGIDLEEYNLFDATVELYPSVAQLQAWKDETNGIILTKKYTEITESSCRQLLLIFQSERLNMFPETVKKYPFSFFTDHMNIVNMKLSLFKKRLVSMLDTLKKYNVLETYTIDPMGIELGITIDFCEFSDIEKKAYNLYSELDFDNNGNDKVVAEQIDGQLFFPLD
ncbi:MAG: hypothetical protein IJN92_08715 [Lachnospiraceae bacterium]|nr:hypothetical protein [Lachnospiraceae bacterium]